MSQSKKVQKITIRNRKGAEGALTVGANTEVLLDGVPLRGARFVKFEVDARKVAKVTIEMFAEVELEANVTLGEPKVKKIVGTKENGKAIAIHSISSYSPTEIVKKSE